MKKYISILLAGLAGICSCGKNYTPVPGPYSSLQTALDSATRPANNFDIDAAAGGSFTTNSGAIYLFPANAFRTATGGVVTGAVQIKTGEYFSKSDFIFSGMYPMSNGEPLVSAGEFSMFPTQDGADLLMADSYSVVLPLAGAMGGMSVYTGTDNTVNTTMGKVNWVLMPDTTKNKVTVKTDAVGITTTKTGWVNGDRASGPAFDSIVYKTLNRSRGARQTFTISLTSGDGLGDDKDIRVYCYFDGLRCMWPMTNIKFGLVTENNISSMKVHFVAFAVHYGYTYAGILAATPEDGIGYHLNMVRTSIEDFRKQVDALP
jgi:hypothetical protein